MKNRNAKTCTINGTDNFLVTVLAKNNSIHLLKMVGKNQLIRGIHYPDGNGAEYFGTNSINYGNKEVPSIGKAKEALGF